MWERWRFELLAGAPERAEATARASLERFQAMRATNQGLTAAALLAYVLAEQVRHEEAIRYADRATAWAWPDDTASQVPAVRAEAIAREAVELSERSDDICQRGDALVQLAAVLDGAGRASDAATALQDAMALYERKGNLVSADRAHTTLAHLGREAGVRTRSRRREFHDIDRVRSGLARRFAHVPTAPTRALASRGRTWSETMAL